MKQTRQSITKTVSLKPEVEFEVIKTVLLRERYLKRLQEKLKANGGKVDLGIIGAFDVLREATIEVVETIDMWEKTQV
jgi:predicted dinucleotide-utilizing enzyme